MSQFSSDGVNIYYEVTGRGFPLVWSHEFGGSYQSWDQQVKFFARRYQVITYAARGYPPSDVPSDPNAYSQDHAVEDLYLLLRHLEIGRAYIGGLSMGGGISLAFALNYPEKVKALVLCDSAGAGVHSPDMQRWQDRFDELRGEQERIVREYGVVEAGYRAIADGMVPPQILEDPVQQEEYVNRLSRFSANGYTYAGRFVMRHGPVENLERVRELTMPTLVVAGDEDIGLLPAIEWLRDTLPNRRYALLTGAGHGTSRWKPDAWRKAVLGFIRDVANGKDIREEVTL